MTNYVVSSGVTSVGISMVAGDLLTVSGASAIAVDTTDVGGTADVSSGGVMSRTALDGGAFMVVFSGGRVVSGTADSSSQMQIVSGGSVSDFNVSGVVLVNPGGVADQVVIGSGGVGILGGEAASGAVASGGTEDIFLSGTDASGTVAGVQRIFEGGHASHDTILSGGFQVVEVFGIAEFEVVDGGGSVVVSGFGILFSATVEAGGVVVLSSGGMSDQDLVQAGSLLSVSVDASVSAITVAGEEVVGGKDLGSTIQRGGLELVSGGTANLGIVESGGKLQAVAGGVVSSAIVSSGGGLTVSAGGLAATTDLKSGASATVMSGGVASGGLVDSGATETVFAGGQEAGETVIGLLNVRGSATSDDVANGGQMVALSGGVIVSAITNFLGEDLISNGGTARATRIAGSGTEVVLSGGVASGTTVFGGGQEIVASGGLATLLKVSSGGSASVEAGGEISGANLASGATLIDGGQVLLANRTLLGTLSGAGRITEIAANGVLTLSENGSAFGGVAAISAGRIELAVAGAIGSGGVLFLAASTASETLQIDAAAAPAPGGVFANTITNFSNDKKRIDLRSLAFSAGASATLSGSTLTLADGGKTYQFHLAGQLGKSFTVAADGSGGTEITAHNTAALVQAAAAIASPAAALQSPASGYGGECSSPIHAATAGGRD